MALDVVWYYRYVVLFHHLLCNLKQIIVMGHGASKAMMTPLLVVLAGFITIAFTGGPMTYAVRLMKLYQYQLLHLVVGISQLWNHCKFCLYLEHHRFMVQYFS